MNDQQTLHLRRLKACMAEVDSLRQSELRIKDPQFDFWRDSVLQSMRILFGEMHDYRRRFSALPFQHQVIFFSGRVKVDQWTGRDQDHWESDMETAGKILRDAIEEFETAPDAAKPSVLPSKPTDVPAINIHVSNVVAQAVSQFTSISLTQVFGELDKLDLSSDVREKAKAEGKALASEINGERRWPAMSKCLDALRALGKPVYEHVDMPLLLDLIKRESGLK
jgi:hypothetical protein